MKTQENKTMKESKIIRKMAAERCSSQEIGEELDRRQGKTMEHTPTQLKEYGDYKIKDSKNRIIAVLDNKLGFDENKAYQKHIITACNAHEALKLRLQNLVTWAIKNTPDYPAELIHAMDLLEQLK